MKALPKKFNTIPEAIEAIRNGEMIIVSDDPDRENEGDLIMAAEKATPETINFMAKYGRGMICLPATAERLSELNLPLMVSENTEQLRTAFTVTIDAKDVTTGISAYERAHTDSAVCPAGGESGGFRPSGPYLPVAGKGGRCLTARRPYRGDG